MKFQRAITGASLADIMAKRNQKPEVRKAQREQAIRYEVYLHGTRSVLTSAAPARTVEMWSRDVQSAFKLVWMLASQLAIAFFSYFA